MPVTKLKTESFLAASRTYLEKNLDKVNTTGSKSTILASEAKKLPKDLRDNVAKLAPDGKAIKKSDLMAGYMKDVTAEVKKADTNKDGYLTLAEAKKLPAHVRDNFNNYANAAGGTGTGLKVKDTTPKLLIAAHQAEYGSSPVGYAEAFKRGIDAVMKDEETGETPRALLRYFAEEEGKPLTDAQPDAKMKKLFKGMELLPGTPCASACSPSSTASGCSRARRHSLSSCRDSIAGAWRSPTRNASRSCAPCRT